MDTIPGDISGFAWWFFSVVLVGVLINVAARYITPRTDRWLERYSKRRREKNTQYRRRIQDAAVKALATPNGVLWIHSQWSGLSHQFWFFFVLIVILASVFIMLELDKYYLLIALRPEVYRDLARPSIVPLAEFAAAVRGGLSKLYRSQPLILIGYIFSLLMVSYFGFEFFSVSRRQRFYRDVAKAIEDMESQRLIATTLANPASEASVGQSEVGDEGLSEIGDAQGLDVKHQLS